MTPVARTGYGVMFEGLTCPHGRVQYGCCGVVGTLSWPRMSVDRLRDTVLVRCIDAKPVRGFPGFRQPHYNQPQLHCTLSPLVPHMGKRM